MARGRKGARKGAAKRKMMRRKGKARYGYRAPMLAKRLGQLIRISNGTNGNSGPQIQGVADGNGSCQIGSWGTDYMNTAQVGGSLQFKLESAVDYGDFAQLFDRYKIIGVKLRFLYQQNIGSTGSTNILPTLNYSFDADDAVVPTTQTEVTKKQYCHTKIMNANRPFSIYIKPRVTLPTTLSGSAVTVPAKWCNSAQPDIPHYGLKFFIQGWQYGTLSAAVLSQLTIQPTYYLALKDTQ